ncbi:MAG: TlpA disulfide reductase family protein [candidate division WOR-3 bacterium]
MSIILSIFILSYTNFKFKDLNGKEIELDSLLERGPVILDFWATWCTYCDEVLDILKEIKEEYKDKIEIIALSWDTQKTASKIEPLLKSRGWNFIIGIDEGKKIGRIYGVLFLPTTFVITKEKGIVYKKVGYNPKEKEEIKKIIEENLKKE